jgi:hypothetical protein
MTLTDKMELWSRHDKDSAGELPEPGAADIFALLLPKIELGEEHDADFCPIMPGLQKYRECVLETPAYDWLLCDIQKHCLLETSSPDTMSDIGNTILQGLPSQLRFSRRESVPSYKMTYTLDWNLVSFLEDQEYNMGIAEALPLVITLSGSREAAQALTCSQYLHQTWPSSAEGILKLLQSVLRAESNKKATGEL